MFCHHFPLVCKANEQRPCFCSRGLYAGVSLDGAVIFSRPDVNFRFYSRDVQPGQILSGSIPPPRAARPLYDALDEALTATPDPTHNLFSITGAGDAWVGRERFVPESPPIPSGPAARASASLAGRWVTEEDNEYHGGSVLRRGSGSVSGKDFKAAGGGGGPIQRQSWNGSGSDIRSGAGAGAGAGLARVRSGGAVEDDWGWRNPFTAESTDSNESEEFRFHNAMHRES